MPHTRTSSVETQPPLGGPPVDIVGLSQGAIDEITDRWTVSETRWQSLKAAMATDHRWGQMSVYATGSMARKEAFELSDLDLFIIHFRRQSKQPSRVEMASLVHALDEARIAAKFEPFSGGGRFLEAHSFADMRTDAGSPQDDATNRFTARMLLLLSSRCLINTDGYHRARKEILDLYWRDCLDEEKPYVPLFLINDIRRHWLTMCLNFERQYPPTRVGNFDSHSSGKRRIGNLKLRATRLLDSYSPALGFMFHSERDGISRINAQKVLVQTPLERLRDIANGASGETSASAVKVIELYADYLRLMRQTEQVLEKKFSDHQVWVAAKGGTTLIGDEVARLMEFLGTGKDLYRFVIV